MIWILNNMTFHVVFQIVYHHIRLNVFIGTIAHVYFLTGLVGIQDVPFAYSLINERIELESSPAAICKFFSKQTCTLMRR